MKKRANDLDGSQWTKYSISVWNDISKTANERKLKHPAMFPELLVNRLIKIFTTEDDKIVLDPFMGSGATLLAAKNLHKQGVGFELNQEYVELAKSNLAQINIFSNIEHHIYNDNAVNMTNYLEEETVDLCITSPPYWDILKQKRTADNKTIRNYGDIDGDLGSISKYEDFLDQLTVVFSKVYKVLKQNKYCVVNVMDIRKKDRFYPLHSDLATKLEKIGYIFDDIIIWDRRQEYNNLRCLGYPYVFRVNKIHEYLLIFKKPIER